MTCIKPETKLILEDARSISEGLWYMAGYAQDATELLDTRIEVEELDGQAEAVELREALEWLQALSLTFSEEVDAYQNKHSP